MSDTIHVGQEVPNFSMPAYFPATREDGEVSLAELTKDQWLVLIFYPADFTFVCPTELADVADHYDMIRSLGVEVVSVSTDTVYCHKAWQETEPLLANVRFPMGADPTGKVSRLFGVYDEATGQALRGTFIIDPDRVLRAQEITYYNVGRNAAELIRKLEAYQFVRNNPGTACPAKWEPGQKVLRPNIQIAGNVSAELHR